VVYLPTVVPEIAYALIWLVALNPLYGPVNLILGGLGLPTPSWSTEPWPARFALVGIAVWQLGESFVVLLAALASIPRYLHEASALDGATTWARLRYILLPLLLPSLLLLTARDMILCLQTNFVPALVITKGGPGYATLFIPLYAYQRAFEDLRLGYAAAVVWTLYLITLLAVGLQWRLGRRRAYEGSLV
jgi:multiple sugar transport system permease protein